MAVEIINKSKDKKPPYIPMPPHQGLSDADQDRWMDLFLQRCHDGHNGLTGYHYAYLTIGSAKTVYGSIIQPYWRDWDHEIELVSADCRKKQWDEAYVKRREFGLTTRFGGFEPVFNSLIMPGSINLLTSADSFRCRQMFTEKTMVTYNNLHHRIPAKFVPKRRNKVRTGYLELERGGGSREDGSQIEVIETADSDNSAKKAEGYRAYSIFLDELFLHPRAPIVLSSSQASIKKGFVKVGHIVMGGSCGAETDAEALAMKSNADMVERMIRDGDKIGLNVFFIPGFACIEEAPETDKNGIPTGKNIPLMKNGYSMEKEAKAWIEKERAKLLGAEDKTRYWVQVKNYPLTLDEVFEVNKKGPLGEAIYTKVDASKRIITSSPAVKTYVMYRNKDNIVEAHEKKGGYIHIATHPDRNKTYIGGTDPIPFSENKIEDGSDYSSCIMNLENQTIDAYIALRSHDADMVIDQTILLQEYFYSNRFPRGAPTMLETNMGGVVRRIYKELGKDYLLANRPRILGDVFVDGNVAKGWRKDSEKSGPLAVEYLISYLKVYADKIKFLRLCKEITSFPKANTDLLDALISCLILERALFAEMKKTAGIGKKYKSMPYMEFDSTVGHVVKKWRQVEIR